MMFLTDDNYFSPEANWEYMSVSQFKGFLECSERQMAELRGDYKRPPSDAMLVGSYVDSWCEGTLEEFKTAHPEIYARQNPANGLKADFKLAEEIIASIRGDPYFMDYLDGDKQTIMTAEMFGCTWKGKFDVYKPDERIVDMKIMKSIDDKFWSKELKRYVSFVEHYKYNYQMIIYTMIEAIATGRDWYLEPFLAVATKEDPPMKRIFNNFLADMEEVQYYVSYYMPWILKIKAGEIDPEPCGKCAWCRRSLPTIKTDYHYILG
jgi:hypothetical protein